MESHWESKYTVRDEMEEKLWTEGLIVFDTSALLDFYYYPNETVESILNSLLPKVEGRLWIPHHVLTEYVENREKVIDKVIAERYLPLKQKIDVELNQFVTKISQLLDEIQKETRKGDRHPFIVQNEIEEFQTCTNKYSESYAKFRKEVQSRIKARENEIQNHKITDKIFLSFKEYLEVGQETNFETILNYLEVGMRRYQSEIPPGYLDFKEKHGVQKFADLIIWMELIKHASETDKDIVFICNDLKFDWCYKDNRGRILKPRHELVDEFSSKVGRSFWMYDMSQFLYISQKYFDYNLDSSKIDEVAKIIRDHNRKGIIYKCGHCETVNSVTDELLMYEWEPKDSSERGMGTENHYQCNEYLFCSSCDGETLLFLDIWEYPLGAHNHSEIQIEHGEIIQRPDFEENFWDMYERAEEQRYILEEEYDKHKEKGK